MARPSKFPAWLLVVLIIIAGIVALIVWSATRPRPGQTMPNQGNRHLQALTDPHEPYNSKPPTSGPHLGNKAPWGISDKQIPDELQIHNLEDGGVIVHYDPAQVSTSTIRELTDIVSPYYLKGKNIILEPYANLDSPIVLTAWTRLIKLPAPDKIAIEQFISAYIGIDHHVAGQ